MRQYPERKQGIDKIILENALQQCFTDKSSEKAKKLWASIQFPLKLHWGLTMEQLSSILDSVISDRCATLLNQISH